VLFRRMSVSLDL